MRAARRWLVLCACIILIGGGLYWVTRLGEETEAVQVSAAFVTPEPTPEPTPTPSPTPEPTPTPSPTPEPEPVVLLDSCLSLDFDELQRQNGDIYAWIDIPDTIVSYPMLQSEEDNYYLMRNVDLSYGYPGCIYTNACDAKDFSSFCTVIYGHNMKDQSMFGSLHNLFDSGYLSQHPRVIIYTPEGILVYRIAAAVVYDDRYISDAFDFDSPEGRQEFIDSIRGHSSIFLEDVGINTDDRVVVLATCNGVSTSRNLIVATYEGRGQLRDEAEAEETD